MLTAYSVCNAFPIKGTETVGAVRRKRGPSSDKREGEGVSSFKGRYTEKSETRQVGEAKSLKSKMLKGNLPERTRDRREGIKHKE